MNWDAIGAVAEAVGAIGVIASLIYVASQVRQNNRNLQITASQNQNLALANFTDRMISDEDANAVWAEVFWPQMGGRQRSGLSAETSRAAVLITYRMFLIFVSSFHTWRSGGLPDSEWQHSVKVIDSYLAVPFVAEWWAGGGQGLFGTEFASYIDNRLAHINEGR